MEALHATGIEEWSQICSDSFVPLRAQGDDAFRGAIAHQDLGAVGVSHVSSTPSVVSRPAPLIAAEPRDDVLVSLHLSGTGWVEQGGRVARLTSGSAAIYEADRPYDLRFDSTMTELVLQVPRERLRLRDAAIRGATARRIDADASSLTILRHFLAGVIAGGPTTGLTDQLAETAIDLVSAALRPYALGHGVQPALSGDALLYSVKVFVQRHLDDPDLDVDTLARQHAVSRRSLETLFAQDGDSPAAFVRRQRLERALRLLGETSASISDVAFEVGFSDVNTFTRAFRRAYDQTPRDWRSEQRERVLDSA